MTRTRTETVVIRPTNNIYTALTGVACVAAIVALAFLWLKWQNIVGADGTPLFLFF